MFWKDQKNVPHRMSYGNRISLHKKNLILFEWSHNRVIY